MTSENAGERGALSIRVECASVFLSYNMPIEVRDAWQRVVASGTGSWRGDLPAGLYLVNTMTPSGLRMHEVVQVEAGRTSEVYLTEEDAWATADEASGTGSEPAGPLGEAGNEDIRERSVPPARLPPMVARRAPAEAGPPVAVPAPPAPGASAPAPSPAGGAAASISGVRLAEATHCTVSQEADGWVFLPTSPLPAVPTARFEGDDAEWLLSLPLNPAGQEPALATCRVSVVQAGPRTRLHLTFSPSRRVTTFLDGTRRTRSYENAEALLAEASELLMWKYSDPPGATLGGLTMQRLGGLDRRRDWVENLAGSFGWIPDARILLAAVLVKDEGERARGLEALFSAAASRPMFTDGLSLALDLLRHWPDIGRDHADERASALEQLADLSAWADWDAINLTTVSRDEA